MDCKTLKNSIKNHMSPLPLALVCQSENGRFLAEDYIKGLMELFDTHATIGSLSEYSRYEPFSSDEVLNILYMDEVDGDTWSHAREMSNLLIVCRKADETVSQVRLPEPEHWHIEAYAKTLLPSFDDDRVRYLCTLCGYDVHRIVNEADKLRAFPEDERDEVLNILPETSLFEADTDFMKAVDSLIDGDATKYSESNIQPSDGIALATSLCKKCILMANAIMTSKKPEELGISQKYHNYMRYKYSGYSPTRLANMIAESSAIDRKLRTGLVHSDEIADYLSFRILKER